MAGILPYALHHRLMTLILGLGLVAAGIWSFQQLKIEAYPDISDTGVVVITVYPGNASEEVEQQVTIPIERALNNVPHVIARRSRTIFGFSVVELTFADGTDDYFARQLVLEKLRDVVLPRMSRQRWGRSLLESASSIATCWKAMATTTSSCAKSRTGSWRPALHRSRVSPRW